MTPEQATEALQGMFKFGQSLAQNYFDFLGKQSSAMQQAAPVGAPVPAVPLPEAQALARQMLSAVPAALGAYKRLLDQEAGSTLDEGLRIERAASLAMNSGVSRAEIDARLARLRRQGR